jgi:hypothetical protein
MLCTRYGQGGILNYKSTTIYNENGEEIENIWSNLSYDSDYHKRTMQYDKEGNCIKNIQQSNKEYIILIREIEYY